MFGYTQEQVDEKIEEAVRDAKKELEHAHKLTLESVRHDHKLEMQQKEFDLKHYKDEELQKKDERIVELTQELAVQKKENEMLDKIVSINADVVDTKDLVKSLIAKLPEINLKNLTIQSK